MSFRLSAHAVVSMVVCSATAFAYDPPPGTARTNFGGAISICAGALKASPGDVSESDYHDYVSKRDAAVAEDPQITTWDTKYLGYVPAAMFPKCEKLFSDYVAGVDAEKHPMLSGYCKSATDHRLDSVFNNYYPAFQKNGAKNTIVWFARKDLEAARWYMHYGEGFNPQGNGCAMNDRYKKAFAPIQAKFDKAEALVKEMESAKGIRFDKVENGNHVVYVDVKTGNPVANSSNY